MRTLRKPKVVVYFWIILYVFSFIDPVRYRNFFNKKITESKRDDVNC